MIKKRTPLLLRIIIAITLGIALGNIFPLTLVRAFATFNSIFSGFLSFFIPLIILGLVTPAIADIGKGAGRLLLITVAIAYLDTVFSGFLSYFVGISFFPTLIADTSQYVNITEAEEVPAYFTINIPPMLDVMTSLIFAFILGLGIAALGKDNLKKIFDDFKDIIVKTIEKVIIPLLPLFIFGIFLIMTYNGQAFRILSIFISIIIVIFALHIFLLLFQYTVTGLIIRRNPLRLLYNMLPAYFTALGTSSSAATIPVTLEQTKRNGVSDVIAGFDVPLCATIHRTGSALKITACAVALMMMQQMPFDTAMFAGFILMLGIMMVAAPGVPGGAIMAALGVLSSILGFNQEQQAMMIALYIAMDSFGTACNVTGDGAIALIVNKIARKEQNTGIGGLAE